MNIKFHSAVIITDNLEKLKDFYINVLAQSVELDFGACVTLKCGISLWKLSENHKIAQHLGQQCHPNGNKNLELCFETEKFEDVIRSIKKHSPNLLHDVTEETWGQKTIRLFDPDKNIIEVGESIPCFVRRMHKEGMTIDQITEKTSIDKEFVEKILSE